MFLDLSAGMLIGLCIQPIFGPELNDWLIVFGAFAAVAPDLDTVIYGLRRGWKTDQFSHNHRDILHYPVIISLLGGIAIAPAGLEPALIWFLATMFHFIHDTVEGGWGIKWLYPFWDKYICLKLDGPRPKIIMSKQEQRGIAAEYGDPNWLSKRVEFSAKLIAEILIFVVVSAITAIAVSVY